MATGPNRLTSSCSRKSAIGWNSIGCRFGDACVVDQAGEAAVSDGLGDGAGRRRDRRFVRHVEDHRRHRLRGLRPHDLAVLRAPHTGEDVKPVLGQVERRGGTDAGGGAGHDDEATVTGVAAHRVSASTTDQPLKPAEACSSPALSSLASLPSICATELLIEFGIACFTLSASPES